MTRMIELFSHAFVQNAFIAGTIVAVLCGIIGYFVILRGQAFASESLSHVGFAGATGAALVGISGLAGMFLLTLISALGMGAIGSRLRGRDVEIGMVLTFVLGLGVLFLSLVQNTTRAVGVLFGSILSVSRGDTWVTLAAGIGVLAALAVIFRPLQFASFDPEVAEARGIPVQRLSILFTLLLAVTVSVAVQVVGVLLVFALLVVPAATAEHLTNRPASMVALSIALAVGSIWGGLALAFIANAPASFFIVALITSGYFSARVYHHFHSPRRYRELPHPTREVAHR
jgi:zinc/manganese transport system permease protein